MVKKKLCQHEEAISELVSHYRPGMGFYTYNGDSQRYWKLRSDCARMCPDSKYAGDLKPTARQWKPWECQIMNAIDFTRWGCECGYRAPYGQYAMAGCSKHD